MMTRIVSQFSNPHGAGGHLAGWIMATRPSNRRRNVWTIDLLDLEPHHHVLEIGFGPGLALEQAASRVPHGLVVGIDHSPVMYRQAEARNRAAIDAGRVRLVTGRADTIPADLGRFDRILSVNVALFWPDAAAVFRALNTRMNPGGIIATTCQPRSRGATAADTDRIAGRLIAALQDAGYRDIRTERLDLRPPAVCVLGQRD